MPTYHSDSLVSGMTGDGPAIRGKFQKFYPKVPRNQDYKVPMIDDPDNSGNVAYSDKGRVQVVSFTVDGDVLALDMRKARRKLVRLAARRGLEPVGTAVYYTARAVFIEARASHESPTAARSGFRGVSR